jgi:anti-sigma regulatory factor (Ser/Thr protein kinase)
VEVTFIRREEAIDITVTDQGPGFDWQAYLTLDESRAFDSHGRGIAMARMLSFDKLEYRGCGNQVVCTINTVPQSKAETLHSVPTTAPY